MANSFLELRNQRMQSGSLGETMDRLGIKRKKESPLAQPSAPKDAPTNEDNANYIQASRRDRANRSWRSARRQGRDDDMGLIEIGYRGGATGTLRLAQSVGTGVEILGHTVDPINIQPLEELPPTAQMDIKGMAGRFEREGMKPELALEKARWIEHYERHAEYAAVGDALKQIGRITADFYEPMTEKTRVKKWDGKNVIDDPEIMKSPAWWVYNIAEQLPNFAISYGAGGATMKGTTMLGKLAMMTPKEMTRIARLGGAVTGGAVAGSLEGSATYQQLIKSGASPSEARDAAYLMTLFASGLNALSYGKLLKVTKHTTAGGKLVRKLGGGAIEGLTEGTEEPAEWLARLAAKMRAGEPIPDDIYEQFIESLKQGATVALPASGLGVAGARTQTETDAEATHLEDVVDEEEANAISKRMEKTTGVRKKTEEEKAAEAEAKKYADKFGLKTEGNTEDATTTSTPTATSQPVAQVAEQNIARAQQAAQTSFAKDMVAMLTTRQKEKAVATPSGPIKSQSQAKNTGVFTIPDDTDAVIAKPSPKVTPAIKTVQRSFDRSKKLNDVTVLDVTDEGATITHPDLPSPTLIPKAKPVAGATKAIEDAKRQAMDEQRKEDPSYGETVRDKRIIVLESAGMQNASKLSNEELDAAYADLKTETVEKIQDTETLHTLSLLDRLDKLDQTVGLPERQPEATALLRGYTQAELTARPAIMLQGTGEVYEGVSEKWVGKNFTRVTEQDLDNLNAAYKDATELALDDGRQPQDSVNGMILPNGKWYSLDWIFANKKGRDGRTIRELIAGKKAEAEKQTIAQQKTDVQTRKEAERGILPQVREEYKKITTDWVKRIAGIAKQAHNLPQSRAELESALVDRMWDVMYNRARNKQAPLQTRMLQAVGVTQLRDYARQEKAQQAQMSVSQYRQAQEAGTFQTVANIEDVEAGKRDMAEARLDPTARDALRSMLTWLRLNKKKLPLINEQLREKTGQSKLKSDLAPQTIFDLARAYMPENEFNDLLERVEASRQAGPMTRLTEAEYEKRKAIEAKQGGGRLTASGMPGVTGQPIATPTPRTEMEKREWEKRRRLGGRYMEEGKYLDVYEPPPAKKKKEPRVDPNLKSQVWWNQKWVPITKENQREWLKARTHQSKKAIGAQKQNFFPIEMFGPVTVKEGKERAAKLEAFVKNLTPEQLEIFKRQRTVPKDRKLIADFDMVYLLDPTWYDYPWRLDYEPAAIETQPAATRVTHMETLKALKLPEEYMIVTGDAAVAAWNIGTNKTLDVIIHQDLALDLEKEPHKDLKKVESEPGVHHWETADGKVRLYPAQTMQVAKPFNQVNDRTTKRGRIKYEHLDDVKARYIAAGEQAKAEALEAGRTAESVLRVDYEDFEKYLKDYNLAVANPTYPSGHVQDGKIITETRTLAKRSVDKVMNDINTFWKKHGVGKTGELFIEQQADFWDQYYEIKRKQDKDIKLNPKEKQHLKQAKERMAFTQARAEAAEAALKVQAPAPTEKSPYMTQKEHHDMFARADRRKKARADREAALRKAIKRQQAIKELMGKRKKKVTRKSVAAAAKKTARAKKEFKLHPDYEAMLSSINQAITGLPVDTVEVTPKKVSFEIQAGTATGQVVTLTPSQDWIENKQVIQEDLNEAIRAATVASSAQVEAVEPTDGGKKLIKAKKSSGIVVYENGIPLEVEAEGTMEYYMGLLDPDRNVQLTPEQEAAITELQWAAADRQAAQDAADEALLMDETNDDGEFSLNNENGYIVFNPADIATAMKNVGKVAKSVGDKISNRYNALKDVFDVESIFKRLAAATTGFQIKNIFSFQDAWVEKFKATTMREFTKLVRRHMPHMSSDALADAVLSAEDERYEAALIKEAGDTYKISYQPIIKWLNKFFKDQQKAYADRGVNIDFFERKISELEQKWKGTEDYEKAKELMAAIAELQGKKFIHIPLQMWLINNIDRIADPSSKHFRKKKTKLMDFVRNKRRAKTIANLVRSGFIDKNQVDPFEILMSYGVRQGYDWSYLNIRDAALKDGLLKQQLSKPRDKDRDWVELNEGQYRGLMTNEMIGDKPVKTYVTQELKDALDSSLLGLDPQTKLEKTMAMYKMLRFYNALFLPLYDVVQSVGLAGISPLHLSREFPAAWRAMRDKDNDWWEASSHGLFSKPFANLVQQTVGQGATSLKHGAGLQGFAYRHMAHIMSVAQQDAKNAKLPFQVTQAAIMDFMNAQWNVAWYLDNVIRLATYKNLKKRGLSIHDAAQAAALAHGDYASVPARTRHTLNKIFFTPTFKIAMVKAHAKMIENFANAVGLGVKPMTGAQKLSAWKSAVHFIVIQAAFDMLLKHWGYEEDEWGKRYVKRINTPDGEMEHVINWSNPINLFTKYYSKAMKAFDTTRPSENRLHDAAASMLYDFHPMYQTAYRALITGKRFNQEPITREFDSTAKKAYDWSMWLATEEIVPAINAYAVKPFNIGKTRKQRMADKAIEENTNFMFSLLRHGIVFHYVRHVPERRIMFEINALKRRFTQSVKKAYIDNGKVPKEWEKNFEKDIKGLVKKLERIRKERQK